MKKQILIRLALVVSFAATLSGFVPTTAYAAPIPSNRADCEAAGRVWGVIPPATQGSCGGCELAGEGYTVGADGTCSIPVAPTPTNKADCEAAGRVWGRTSSVGTTESCGTCERAGEGYRPDTTGTCALNGASGSGSAVNEDVEVRSQRKKDDCTAEELNGDNCGIVGLLNVVFNLVSGAVTLAVIGNIIVAGIQYSSAQGDPGTAAKAKTRIRNAVLAFIMYVSLYGFVQWLIPGGVF